MAICEGGVDKERNCHRMGWEGKLNQEGALMQEEFSSPLAFAGGLVGLLTLVQLPRG